eukprot:Phypoly_transcript_03157.p1 GENE.Phypoly_transcript_03157~~Phypoly_transcript_03157.p1  ORF type:complete len:474 (+),score=106.74 Phypoly_transcript_03157:1122-2543(+)
MATSTLFRAFMAKPLEQQLQEAHKILTNTSITQKEAREVMNILRKENRQSPALFGSYLSGIARRGNEEELKRGIETANKLGHTIVTKDTKLFYLQLHAAKRNPSELFKMLDSFISEKKAVPPQIFAFCVKSLGRSRGNLAQLSNVWRLLMDNGAAPDRGVRFSFVKQSAEWGDVRAASKHLKTLLAEDNTGLEPRHFLGVIGAYAKQNDKKAVDYWIGQMKSVGVKPELNTYNVLINAAALHGDTGALRAWMKEMKSAGIEPDVVTYNTLINGAIKQGDLRAAEGWLGVMKKLRLPMTQITFAPFLDDAAKRGDMEGVQKWINELVAHKIKPHRAIFHSLIMHACERKNTPMVQHWLSEMEREGVTLDAPMYAHVINLAVQIGDLQSASAWMRDMKQQKVTHAPYDMLVRIAARSGDTKTASYWLEEMKKERITPEKSTYLTLTGATTGFIPYEEWVRQFTNSTNSILPVKIT